MGACASDQRKHVITIEVLQDKLKQTQSVAKIRAESICSLRNERDKLRSKVNSLNNTVLEQEGQIDELLNENESYENVKSQIDAIFHKI